MTPFTLQFRRNASNQALACRYELKAPGGKQRRWVGRDVLRPVIDLTGYRAEAVFDWVEVEVELCRSSQPHHISAELETVWARPAWIRPIAGGSSRTTTSFQIRVQDPKAKTLQLGLDVLSDCWGLRQVRVSAMEVSLDVYPLCATDEARQLMTGILQRHFLPRGEIRKVDKVCRAERSAEDRADALADRLQARQAWGRGPGNSIRIKRRNAAYLRLDSTQYMGPLGTSRTWRVMDKVTNNRRGKVADALPPASRRSRVEVTLDAVALQDLGIVKLEDLHKFNAERLSRDHFSFWLPTLPSNPREVFIPSQVGEWRRRAMISHFEEKGIQSCLEGDYEGVRYRRMAQRARGRPSARLGYTGTLLAWSEMTELARQALLKLRL
jgi:hypothetical protein